MSLAHRLSAGEQRVKPLDAPQIPQGLSRSTPRQNNPSKKTESTLHVTSK